MGHLASNFKVRLTSMPHHSARKKGERVVTIKRNTACFRDEIKTGVVFWLFFKIAYVQPYHSKGLGESFPLMWLKIGLC